MKHFISNILSIGASSLLFEFSSTQSTMRCLHTPSKECPVKCVFILLCGPYIHIHVTDHRYLENMASLQNVFCSKYGPLVVILN